MSRAAQIITHAFGTTEPRMPDRKEDTMTRILSIALAALMLTAIAAPSAEAAHRHHSARHHTVHHSHSMRHSHAMRHGRSNAKGMTTRSAPAGDASTDQLNQQSLNQARGAQ